MPATTGGSLQGSVQPAQISDQAARTRQRDWVSLLGVGIDLLLEVRVDRLEQRVQEAFESHHVVPVLVRERLVELRDRPVDGDGELLRVGGLPRRVELPERRLDVLVQRRSAIVLAWVVVEIVDS